MTAARCPSDLALEIFLIKPERSPLGAHLEACPPCAARIARMRAEGEEFRRVVFPQTVDAVEDAMVKRRFGWKLVLAPVSALAVATAAVLFMVRSGPPSDYEYGVKGTGMALGVFVNGEGSGARAVPDGAAVPASAALRFKVQPAADCWLWIMSVDAKGEISRLYPPKGTPPEKRATGPVPGGAMLDGQPGPERIYAVCAPDETMAWGEVKAAAAEVATGGEERVRAARGLGGSLARANQATLLLEKRP